MVAVAVVVPRQNRGFGVLHHLQPFDEVTARELGHIETIACALEMSVDGLYELAIAILAALGDSTGAEYARGQWQRYHFLCRQRAQYQYRRLTA